MLYRSTPFGSPGGGEKRRGISGERKSWQRGIKRERGGVKYEEEDYLSD